jgi:hypothetical protein
VERLAPGPVLAPAAEQPRVEHQALGPLLAPVVAQPQVERQALGQVPDHLPWFH